jgi:hypothetical protein
MHALALCELRKRPNPSKRSVLAMASPCHTLGAIQDSGCTFELYVRSSTSFSVLNHLLPLRTQLLVRSLLRISADGQNHWEDLGRKVPQRLLECALDKINMFLSVHYDVARLLVLLLKARATVGVRVDCEEPLAVTQAAPIAGQKKYPKLQHP